MSTRWPEYDVKCEGACSSCQALLAINMEELKAVNEYDKNAGMTVVIGGKNEFQRIFRMRRSYFTETVQKNI